MIRPQRAHWPAMDEDQDKLRQISGDWLIGLEGLGMCCGSVRRTSCVPSLGEMRCSHITKTEDGE